MSPFIRTCTLFGYDTSNVCLFFGIYNMVTYIRLNASPIADLKGEGSDQICIKWVMAAGLHLITVIAHLLVLRWMHASYDKLTDFINYQNSTTNTEKYQKI